MASYMVARHLLWKWIPAPYCLRGKLSIFLYFVVSFHLLELLDRSGRYLLLWVLHKSVPMSSSPSQSMGFIQLTWTAMAVHVRSAQSHRLPRTCVPFKCLQTEPLPTTPAVMCALRATAVPHWIQPPGTVGKMCQGNKWSSRGRPAKCTRQLVRDTSEGNGQGSLHTHHFSPQSLSVIN